MAISSSGTTLAAASLRLEAKQHGVLDAGGRVDSSTFAMLANQKDVDPHDPVAAIRAVRIKTQGPLAANAIDTTFAVYGDGRALTYLPDPLAVEIAARLFGHPDIADDEIITIPLYPAGTWPEAQPFLIEVCENPLERPHFDAASRTLRIPLPKGVQAKLRLSMKLAPDALEKMGVFAWLDAPDQAAQRKRAGDGQHWMLTPWRVVDLVHAVQRPLVTPEITEIAIWPRAAGSTFAVPAVLASCSIDSTDRMDLLAEWHEPIDDAAVAESAAAPADRQRRFPGQDHRCAVLHAARRHPSGRRLSRSYHQRTGLDWRQHRRRGPATGLQPGPGPDQDS